MDTPKFLLFCGVIAVSAATPAVATAHGQFPTAVSVQRESGPDGRWVVVTNYGLLYLGEPAPDGGFRARMVCDEVAGDAPAVPVSVGGMGEVVTAWFKGVYVSSDGGCNFDVRDMAGAPHFVRAFARPGDGRLYAVTSSGALSNDVFGSDDGGASFEPENATAGISLFLTTVQPLGNAGDLAAAGFASEGNGFVLAWRREGQWFSQPLSGWALESHGQPVLDDCADSGLGCLLRGDDDREARLGWVDIPAAASGEAVVRVVRSAADQYLVGAVSLPSGAWVVATRTGLWRSRDAGETWQAIAGPAMPTGLSRVEGKLFVLANPYLPGSDLAAESDEDGDNWRTLLRGFPQVESLVQCGQNAALVDICEPLWPDTVSLLGVGTADMEWPGRRQPTEPDDGQAEDQPDAAESGSDEDIEAVRVASDGCRHGGASSTMWVSVALIWSCTRRRMV